MARYPALVRTRKPSVFVPPTVISPRLQSERVTASGTTMARCTPPIRASMSSCFRPSLAIGVLQSAAGDELAEFIDNRPAPVVGGSSVVSVCRAERKLFGFGVVLIEDFVDQSPELEHLGYDGGKLLALRLDEFRPLTHQRFVRCPRLIPLPNQGLDGGGGIIEEVVSGRAGAM